MKIALLCRRPPFPLTNGESLRIFNLARGLSMRHPIDLISLGSAPAHDELRHIFTNIDLLPEHASEQTHPAWQVWNSLRVSEFQPHYPDVEAHLASVGGSRRYDVIWTSSDMVTSIPNGGILGGAAIVVDVCDDNVLMLRRELSQAAGIVHRLRLLKRLWVAREFERRFYAPAPLCTFASSDDAMSLASLAPAATVAVVANGVDTDYFSPGAHDVAEATVVFEGSMDFGPNRDAAIHLCKDIMPIVRRQRPAARAVIVGRNPPPSVLALASREVEVTGFVDDIRPFVRSATVFACPLRTGSGIRNKVLQAWAMAKAVVASPIGLGGLDYKDGHNVLVGSTPESLAAGIVRLLDDAHLRHSLGSAARLLACQSYAWHAKALEFEQLMASARRGSRA